MATATNLDEPQQHVRIAVIPRAGDTMHLQPMCRKFRLDGFRSVTIS